MTKQGKIFYLIMKYKKYKRGRMTNLATSFMVTGKVLLDHTVFKTDSELKEWFNKMKKGETWAEMK